MSRQETIGFFEGWRDKINRLDGDAVADPGSIATMKPHAAQ
jgi:hypothetical protein